MSNIFEIIGNVANALAKTGDTCKASGLANFLNQNNHKTTRGGFFQFVVVAFIGSLGLRMIIS